MGWSGLPSTLIGPVGVALDQDRNRAGVEGVGAGEVVGLAEDQVFGRFDVGIDRLVGLLGASGKAGQGHRRAHDLEESATGDGIDPLRSLARELALQHLVEAGSVGQLLEAAPVALAALAGEPGARLLKRKGAVGPLAGDGAVSIETNASGFSIDVISLRLSSSRSRLRPSFHLDRVFIGDTCRNCLAPADCGCGIARRGSGPACPDR